MDEPTVRTADGATTAAVPSKIVDAMNAWLPPPRDP
jgi:hypothetical protein